MRDVLVEVFHVVATASFIAKVDAHFQAFGKLIKGILYMPC
jgi:hypothetical protein